VVIDVVSNLFGVGRVSIFPGIQVKHTASYKSNLKSSAQISPAHKGPLSMHQGQHIYLYRDLSVWYFFMKFSLYLEPLKGMFCP